MLAAVAIVMWAAWTLPCVDWKLPPGRIVTGCSDPCIVPTPMTFCGLMIVSLIGFMSVCAGISLTVAVMALDAGWAVIPAGDDIAIVAMPAHAKGES